jgi:hypothetical protein
MMSQANSIVNPRIGRGRCPRPEEIQIAMLGTDTSKDVFIPIRPFGKSELTEHLKKCPYCKEWAKTVH